MLKKITLFQVITLFVFVLLICAGCSQPVEPEEIIIGVAWPFESNNSSFNEGIDLAVREINASGGIRDKELKLLKKDDKGNLEQGMAIAQSFAENKKIQAVIGHRASYISIPASVVYNNAGLVMLSPASSAPSLTKRGYEHIFRVIPSDDEIAKQLAIYLAEQGHRRMVIYYSDDSYGTGLANSFEDHAKAQGITIVDRFSYYSGLDDLKYLHNRWQAFGFDGIFMAKTLAGGSQFVLDAGEAGINVPISAGNALDDPRLIKIAGEAAEGTIIGSIFNPNADRPEVKKFVHDFRQEYKEMPTPHAALGYDAVKMLAAAIEKSALPDPSTVKEALFNLGKWPGASGVHEFDETGDNMGNIVKLKIVRNGELEFIR